MCIVRILAIFGSITKQPVTWPELTAAGEGAVIDLVKLFLCSLLLDFGLMLLIVCILLIRVWRWAERSLSDIKA